MLLSSAKGGISISWSNGKLETLGHIGVGLGLGIGYDLLGELSDHSLSCGSGYIGRTGLKANAGMGLGAIGGAVGFIAATGNGFSRKEGEGFINYDPPSFNIDPSISGNHPRKLGISVGGSYGADIGSYINWK